MTIYQEEIRRKVRPYDCDCAPLEGSEYIGIYYEGALLAEAGPKGDLRYYDPSEEAVKEVLNKILADARLVQEYVRIYESSAPMTAADVGQYRQFSEHNRVVLAGTYDKKFGFMFCTWDKSGDGSYVIQGHYTTYYQDAKEDFAVRSGLIPQYRLFDINSSTILYDALSFAGENDENIDYQQSCVLADLQEQLAAAYPQLSARQVSPAQDAGMTQSL